MTSSVLARRLLALALATAPALGQDFRRLEIPDDVPAHLCTALAQDRAGFLWIGTQAGLVRFDGYEFRRFPPSPGASYVRTLLAAADGRVWAGTFAGGLVEYDPASDRLRDHRDGLSHERVEALAEDRDGRIWIATQQGLDRLDPGSGRLDHYRHDPADPRSLADDRVRALLVDRGGQLWVGTRAGLQAHRAGRFEPPVAGLAGQFVSKLLEDERGRIWVGTTEHGAARFDPRSGEVRRVPKLGHFWVYGLAQVGPGEIWVATFGAGIDVVDAATLQVTARLRADPTQPQALPGDRIGALLRDRAGLVWVGTWGQGLARHDPATRAFRALRHRPGDATGLSHPAAVRAMQTREGEIWVGTNGNGVDVFDAGWRRLRTLLPGTAVTSLAQGPDGAAWVATLSGRLHRIAGGTTRTLGREQGLPGGAIRTIVFGPDGETWTGAAEGLARIDGHGVAAFRHHRDDPATLPGDAVEAIAFDGAGRMWVGTDNGLAEFDRARGTARRVSAGLPNNWVPDLMVDAKGRLWVGTSGGACVLEAWDGQRVRCPPVAPRLSLPPAPAECLIEDAQGQVWIGPRLRVDPATWRATELGAADGRAFRTFYIASRARTREGVLLFGSPEGLLVVQPAELRTWTWAPPVVATSLRVGGEGRPVPPSIELAAPGRSFRLDFAALDFTAPELLAYRYRLEGHDDDWIPTDAARRSATYTNLRPGAYTLHVQATNRAGAWSPHELRLAVTARPAFHETTLFRLLCVVAGLGLARAAWRARVRHIEARGRALERVVQERTAELKAAYVRIEEASLTDPLTGLRNRRFLEQAIGMDVELARRQGGDLLFLLVDLDRFKSVNDQHGHPAGDAVLVQTAAILRAIFRSSDYLVRWGGEEFLVVSRFVARADVPRIAEKLRAGIAAHPFRVPGREEPLRRTGSIGVAAFPGPATWEAAVAAADAALYEAKSQGRDRWVLAP